MIVRQPVSQNYVKNLTGLGLNLKLLLPLSVSVRPSPIFGHFPDLPAKLVAFDSF